MDYTQEFDIFWEAYPCKKGKSKAEEYWQKHKPVLSKVMAALELQKKERIWLELHKKFVPEWPFGSTWVNQRRWRDGYNPDFEKYLKRKLLQPARERREREAYKMRIRDEYQEYLEGKTVQALQDIKKDGGHIAGLCGWLIDEILVAKKG